MAFNFNWSPLIADTERVRDMLTYALNKSTKPPIIVDDIIVNELNLGSTPPELEILEIGDLAEDRFRGIFKMSYTGDAYLTLKTRVQANPLNTYLSTKPSFASPQPLAASSGLTIPVQITLSDIRLSGFVILVFSKQKGITIVFRNDPLEKLKVSSTFDSIPFVRDYLQKTIEKQLRVLFVEDLPAIIHRLSLRVFGPESRIPETPEFNVESDDQRPIDPFASPLQQATDGEPDPSSFLLLETPSDSYPSFSPKNLQRLAALSDNQRTLSLVTPEINDSVYRAIANIAMREDSTYHGSNTPTLRPSTLSHIQSSLASKSAWSSAASHVSDTPSVATRPTLPSLSSAQTLSSFGNNSSRSRPGKKRKHRIVNLRKSTDSKDSADAKSVSSNYDEAASRSVGGSAESSIISAESDQIPSSSSHSRGSRIQPPLRSISDGENSLQDQHKSSFADQNATIRPSKRISDVDSGRNASPENPRTHAVVSQLPRMQSFSPRPSSPEFYRMSSDRRGSSDANLPRLASSFGESSSGGILEQAWMQKMAQGVARKVAEEKSHHRQQQPVSWPNDEGQSVTDADAPPAYVS